MDDRSFREFARIAKDFDKSGMPQVLRDLDKSSMPRILEDIQKSSMPRILEDVEKFRMRKILEDVQRSGLPQGAKDLSEWHRGHLHNFDTVATEISKQPIDEFAAARWYDPELVNHIAHLESNVVPKIDTDAWTAASKVAAQTFENLRSPSLLATLPQTPDQFTRLLNDAARLTYADHIRDLLEITNEVMQASQVDFSEPAQLDGLPELPQLQWMFELDRATLVFLCKLLFHLTFILGPALGVEIVMSDGEIKTEELPAVFTALNVMLFYALMALGEKSDQ